MRRVKTGQALIVAITSLFIANQSHAIGFGGKLVFDRPTIKDYDHLKFNLVGVANTIQLGAFDSLFSPAVHGQYSRGSVDTPNGKTDVNYFEGSATFGNILYHPNDNFMLRAYGGVGIGIADLNVQTSTGKTNTDSSFVVFPIGLEANYLIPNTNVSFYSNAAFKHFIDVSDIRSRCVDGRIPDRRGFHVCDANGGFASDSEFPVGKMNGFQIGFGIKLFY